MLLFVPDYREALPGAHYLRFQRGRRRESNNLNLYGFLTQSASGLEEKQTQKTDSRNWNTLLQRYLIGKDRRTIIILPRDEIFGVGDEFRIRARAQFVKIHALAFSLKCHPEWTDAVER